MGHQAYPLPLYSVWKGKKEVDLSRPVLRSAMGKMENDSILNPFYEIEMSSVKQ